MGGKDQFYYEREKARLLKTQRKVCSAIQDELDGELLKAVEAWECVGKHMPSYLSGVFSFSPHNTRYPLVVDEFLHSEDLKGNAKILDQVKRGGFTYLLNPQIVSERIEMLRCRLAQGGGVSNNAPCRFFTPQAVVAPQPPVQVRRHNPYAVTNRL